MDVLYIRSERSLSILRFGTFLQTVAYHMSMYVYRNFNSTQEGFIHCFD